MDQFLFVKNFYFGVDFDQKVFEVSFELLGNGFICVRVFNFKGCVVYDFDLGSFFGIFSDWINFLKNGFDDYFLEVIQGGKSLVWKVEIWQQLYFFGWDLFFQVVIDGNVCIQFKVNEQDEGVDLYLKYQCDDGIE